MLFNSLDFAILLPIVFVLYWLLNSNLRVQNSFLILTGFVFYGWWDWRFLGLLIFTSGTDYLVAIGLERATSSVPQGAAGRQFGGEPGPFGLLQVLRLLHHELP